MADENKRDDALQAPENENVTDGVKDMDDKSINELLKEYAEDVKDRDLDEFLKDNGDEDAFEGDDDGDDAIAAPAPKKSGGGFLTTLMFLVVCGAAGAGAWMYLNKDEGMTTVMGGFSGEPVTDATTATMDTPPIPDGAPSMPVDTAANDTTAIVSPFPAEMTPSETGAETAGSDVPAPTPIMNQTDAPETDATTPASVSDTTATADLLAQPIAAPEATAPAETTAVETETAATPAVASEPVTAPAATEDTVEVSQAVDDWMSSAADGMAEVEAKADAKLAETPEASEPSVDVAEVKAEPAKTETKTETIAEPAAESAPAPKKAVERSPYDEALDPPYVAIQAGKGGATTTTAKADVTNTEPKMAPVVEGVDAGNGEVYKKRGSTAGTEPAETRAGGMYKDLVKQGGGVVELPGLSATVKNDITVGQAVVPAQPANPAVSMPVDNGPTRLAIHGGKSLPPGTTVRVSDTATVTAKLPQQLNDEPQVAAVPVEPVQTEQPAAQQPERAPAPSTAPASDGLGELRNTLNQAVAAEKSGDAARAISLYQRALELDAVYGDGQTIDRGMVYDRIGALRAQR